MSDRVGLLAMAAIVAAGMFAGAGTVRWPAGWGYLSVVAAGLVWHQAHLAARRPGLLERRSRIRAGTEQWDLAWLALFWPMVLAAPVVAGVETVRLGPAPLPWWVAAGGAALLAAGVALSARAMVANPYFEGTVRLQPDQRVVDAGPYRRLRLPGDAGLALWVLGAPLLTRSAWTLALGSAAAAWLAVRTALEDRLLRRSLPGYRAYAERVRWRLIPGLW